MNKLRQNLYKDERGVVLLTVLMVGLIITFVGLSFADLAMGQYARTTKNVFNANALQVSEAGAEQSLHRLNELSSFTGYGEQVFYNSAEQGRGTYQTVISAGTGQNEKVITSTGRVYRYNKTTDPVSTRVVKVTVVGTSSPGFSVHTGPGGLILSGSANITNSEVYVNGTISLSGASKIGTNAKPLNVHVAYQSCPNQANPGATYPQVCTSGQPITMAQSTNIYGTVCATRQTSYGPNPSHNILPGVSGSGLVPNCVAPVVTMPTYDRSAHIASMTTTQSATSNTVVCSQWPFQRTWPAGLRMNGNVNVASSCEVTINGNAYITGNFDIGGAAKITVAESAGTTRPVVLVDGKITVGGSGRVIANSQGTGVQFISFKSSASCTPSCANVTGTDLYNSRNLETISIGGAVNLPGMIFQAYWGKATLAGSGSVGSILGQTVDLSGAGTVTFGTTLSSGESQWNIRSYQQIFPN